MLVKLNKQPMRDLINFNVVPFNRPAAIKIRKASWLSRQCRSLMRRLRQQPEILQNDPRFTMHHHQLQMGKWVGNDHHLLR